jgi:tRNA threonylcarbamoyl adenosine modification protein (Sua5/YciO/YrdC/YwlC family)
LSGRLWTGDRQGIEAASAAIGNGAVIAFPTDTVFGIACSATAPESIASLCRIKARSVSQPLVLMAAGWEQLADYMVPSPAAAELARRFWPGPLTLIVAAKQPGEALGGVATVGVRIPAHPIALELLERTGPLATTSANRHGRPPADDAATALAQLPELAGAIADDHPARGGRRPSSILDLTRDPPVLIREGAVSASELGVPLASPRSASRRD